MKTILNKKLLTTAISTVLISACGGSNTDPVAGDIAQPGADNVIVISDPQPSVVEETESNDSVASEVSSNTDNTSDAGGSSITDLSLIHI